MRRREVLKNGFPTAGVLAASSMLPVPAAGQIFPVRDTDLKINGVRLVKTRPRQPLPVYQPRPGSFWAVGGATRPISIYPKYHGNEMSWRPDRGLLDSFTVEVSTNKGVSGYGHGGPGGAPFVEGHLKKLLLDENPFDVEKLWDIMWRATLLYGRKGAVIHAISGVDLALWDVVGKVCELPVYRLLGGETKAPIPAYSTGNDYDQSVEFGFKRIKLALRFGPADGRAGIRKNVEDVKKVREALGPDGEIMLDCWMALTERYTLDLAEALEPYRVYWIEEALQADDYEGYGRLNRQIKSTRIVTGEHEYTRYGFRQLLANNSAAIWQPDVQWCGGMTELRRIGALAAANDIPLIPHAGGMNEAVHYVMATPNSPWAELFLPPPGGPDVVYQRFADEKNITRGPEGIYTRPSDKPGFGWDFEVE